MRRLAAQAALLLALASVPAIAEALYFRDKISWSAPVAEKDQITVSSARALGDRAMWVDARPEDEFNREHVPGAILLNEDRWNELLPQMLQVWSPDRPVIVYCSSQGCGASREVARRLRTEAGLNNVVVLQGGWEAWLAAKK